MSWDQVKAYLAGIPWMTIAGAAGRVLAILVLAWIVLKVLKHALARMQRRLERRAEAEGESYKESHRRSETLVSLLRQGLFIVVWVLAILTILKELGLDIAPILAGAGVVGLAVGFGAQNLVRDVISGFFMILENQVRVGDVAIINGQGGLVEAVNFRTVVLRDLAGTMHVFPNGTITTLANMTYGWSGYVFEIGVAYKEDTDRVVEVLRSVAEELRADPEHGHDILEAVEIFGVDQFADSAVVIKGRIKTRPLQQWAVGREFLRRVKQAFDREGIEIPFPHRTLYVGEGQPDWVKQLGGQGSTGPAIEAGEPEDAG